MSDKYRKRRRAGRAGRDTFAQAWRRFAWRLAQQAAAEGMAEIELAARRRRALARRGDGRDE